MRGVVEQVGTCLSNLEQRFSSLQSVVMATLIGVASLVVSVVVGGTAPWLNL